MTNTPTLTDRYVEATLRRLPAHQRPDIERELRASIADAIDDRIEGGTGAAGAEVAVLTALGDPERLAAGYADRPLHLIGPRFYLDYMRLLKTLLAVVPTIVAAVVVVVQIFERDNFGTIVGTTVSATITTALHVAFWTTLVFAVLERTPAHKEIPTRTWTPDQLPEPTSRRAKFGELVAMTTFTVLFSALILLSPLWSTETDATGDPIPFLNPWLFSSGFVYVFVGLVTLSLAGAFAKYYLPGRRSVILGSGLVDLAPPILLIWAASGDRLLNPAFVEAAGWTGAGQWIQLGLIIGAALTIVSTVFETIRGLARV